MAMAARARGDFVKFIPKSGVRPEPPKTYEICARFRGYATGSRRRVVLVGDASSRASVHATMLGFGAAPAILAPRLLIRPA